MGPLLLWFRAGLLLLVTGIGAAPVLAAAPVPVQERAAGTIMGACASIWTIKNPSELGQYEQRNNQAIEFQNRLYATNRPRLVEDFQKAQKEVERADNALDQSAMGEAATNERAEASGGILNRAQVEAIAVKLLNTANYREINQANAALEKAAAAIRAMDREAIAWNVIAAGVADCIKDQREYIAQNAPVAPPAAPPTPGTDVLTVSGNWTMQCHIGDVIMPVSGRFSIQIGHDRRIVASFVDGASATISGGILPSGDVNASGSMLFQKIPMLITTSGHVGNGPDGRLVGSGSMTVQDTGSDTKCSGQWHG